MRFYNMPLYNIVYGIMNITVIKLMVHSRLYPKHTEIIILSKL